MKHVLLLLMALFLVSLLSVTLTSGTAWAWTGLAGPMVTPNAPGAAIPQSGRTTPAIVGLLIAFVTLLAALLLWLRRRQRQVLAQRIVQEKTTEIRQLAEKSNYEVHVKDLAEALDISPSLAEEVMRVTGAHLLSARTGGGLYQLPHIVEKGQEDKPIDVGSPRPRPSPEGPRPPTVAARESAPPASGPAGRAGMTKEPGDKKPGPSRPA